MSNNIIPDGDAELNRQIQEALGYKPPLPEFIKSAESVPMFEVKQASEILLPHLENLAIRELLADNMRLRERLDSVSEEIHRQMRLCEDVIDDPQWTKRAEHTIDTLARVLGVMKDTMYDS